MLRGKPSKRFRKPHCLPCSAACLLYSLFCSSVTDAAKLKLHRIYWGRVSHQLELARLLPPGSLIGCEGGKTLESSPLPFEP